MELEIIGTLVGLVYLWLEYKASIYLWIASIVMPAIYLFVYFDAGLYADFGINVYYLLIALYGWMTWKYGKTSTSTKKEVNELPITHLPKQGWINVALAYVVFQFMIAWILIQYTDSNVPWMDAFTTALSIVGMWMLARKYVEQWGVWLVVDVASAGLYIYKSLYFTAVLYALYAIIAIFGYKKWKSMML